MVDKKGKNRTLEKEKIKSSKAPLQKSRHSHQDIRKDNSERDKASKPLSLEKELATAKEQLLRSLAEAENVRKRSEKQITDAHKYGVSGMARDFLGVSENLRMALTVISPEDKKRDEKLKNLAIGLDMILKDFKTTFERHGIKDIDPKIGEVFDYTKHQAMGEVETEDVEKGKIAQVLSIGYTIHDRLLKPAMVNVATKKPSIKS